MNVKTMIEWLNEAPPDYEMCFSQYTSVVMPTDSTNEYFIVLDDPIVGVLKNDGSKEIRFFTESSQDRVIAEIENGKDWKKLE